MSDYQFNDYIAISIVEGITVPESDEHEVAAYQYLIDAGIVWTLEESIGRRARYLIEQGVCKPSGG